MGKFVMGLVFQLCVLFWLSGCTDTDDAPLKQQVGNLTITKIQLGIFEFNKLEGQITSDFAITNDQRWVINGALTVEDGATLTIEPGTTVYASFNDTPSYLSVQQGGMINANGSAGSPIHFTTIRELTSIPQPGDWGGIIINGRAPLNTASGTAEGEGGTGTYGGNDTDDNSGILRYVIVSYAGQQLGEGNELNGISLNAVGHGTTVEFIEAIYGLDDGIELFGGTVNVKYAVSLGNADDSFDWSLGWSGFGQFWVAQQDPFGGDRGIEADNDEDNVTATPFSMPTVANITLVGADDGDGKNTGMKLRHGTKGFIYNALVTHFPKDGVDVDDSSSPFISTDELLVSHSFIFNNNTALEGGVNYRNADAFENDNTNQFEEEPLIDGFAGVITGAGFDASQIDDWFTATNYIGAVSPENDWTSGWVSVLR